MAPASGSDTVRDGGSQDPRPPKKKQKRDGRTKIVWNDYYYTQARKSGVKIVYRCSYWRSGCGAKLELMAATMEYDFENAIPHTCGRPITQPAITDTGARDLRPAMKTTVERLAIQTTMTPMQVWEDVREQFLGDTTTHTARTLTLQQVVKLVHRLRSEHFGNDIYARIESPPLVNVKNSDLYFYQFHHAWVDQSARPRPKLNRIVGWANPALMQLLHYENISLFVDGTFRIVPRSFKQCIVIMVYDRGSKLYVPVFFILATSKSSDTYWNSLQFVSNACGVKLKPKEVVCDFERALITAVGDWFDGVRIIGCLFHFKQAVRRRMKKERLPEPEVKIAMERGVLDVLTVLEHERIPQGIKWVKKKIRDRCEEEGHAYSRVKWNSFWRYFQRTWIDMFPPKFWNIHDVLHSAVARTNNALERCNRKLNDAFPTPHPSLPRFIQTIEEVSRQYVNLRNDTAAGRSRTPQRERFVAPKAPSDAELEACASSAAESSDEDVDSASSGSSSSSDQDEESGSEPDGDQVEEYEDYIRFDGH